MGTVATSDRNQGVVMTEDTALDRVRRFTGDDADQWMEYSGVALVDVLNEDDVASMKLGAVGFLRAPAGAHSTFDFAYDEVLVVSRGSCTVRSEGAEVHAGAGEVVYLPARVPGSFEANTELELVYVASPPYGEVNREAKARLLDEASS
jgi:ethanolamine utilization protein EutQ (cupin superfamily)